MVTDVFEAPAVEIKERCTASIREHVLAEFKNEGWATNVKVDQSLGLTVFAMRGDLACQLQTGNHAISYMMGEGVYSDRDRYPFPTLIITDLHMPNGDGYDVLEFLQQNPEWSVVPRIMFSSSDNDDDVRTAFALGVSAYHIKPIGGEKLADCMRSILEYWASCEVPPINEAGRLLITNSTGRLGARYPQAKGSSGMKRPEQGAPIREELLATRLL